MQKIVKKITNYFEFENHSATFKKEIIGGLSTFLAMAYILAVNPGMLNAADSHFDPTLNDGVGGIVYRGYQGVFFLGTALSAFLGTLFMGLFAKVPVAVAPGMGVNAFFTYTVASNILGLSLEEALIATFCSGILYAIIALTPARIYIGKMLPQNFKLGIGAMLGFFLAYVGLVNSGIVVSGANAFGPDVNHGGIATPTKLGNFADPFVIVSLVVLLLVFVFHFLKIKGAVIFAILLGVIMLALLNAFGVKDSDKIFALQNYQDFNKFGELSKSMWSSFGSALSNGKFYIALFVFLYIDFFDTTGMLFSLGKQADFEENGKWLKKANIVDAASTIGGSILLTSTTTSYSESTVGVSQGARTGLASLVSSLMFLLSIAIWPIMTPILPIEHIQDQVYAQGGTIMPVTGPILVLVGSLMVGQLRHFDWKKALDIPVLFITLIFGMLSYSISSGIAAGIIAYFVINFVVYLAVRLTKKDYFYYANTQPNKNKDYNKNKLDQVRKEILNPVIIILLILAIAYFATMPLYYG